MKLNYTCCVYNVPWSVKFSGADVYKGESGILVLTNCHILLRISWWNDGIVARIHISAALFAIFRGKELCFIKLRSIEKIYTKAYTLNSKDFF